MATFGLCCMSTHYLQVSDALFLNGMPAGEPQDSSESALQQARDGKGPWLGMPEQDAPCVVTA